MDYFNYIEEKLHNLASRIETRGKLNLLDSHLHLEDFYCHFFNKLFSWQLKNQNEVQQNSEAIDLIDSTNKIVIQVSATATVKKVSAALSKFSPNYTDYKFKFISISKDANKLRNKEFNSNNALTFDPQQDIYDIPAILKIVKGLEIERQQEVFLFIKQELGKNDLPQFPNTTNLANIVNILAQKDWSLPSSSPSKVFDIDEKIQHNKLDIAKKTIDDYKIHHTRVDKVYSEFDTQGLNKSVSVLDSIRRYYVTFSNQYTTNRDQVFNKIVEALCNKVMESANYTPIPQEELELCVNILAVDAFIRCKIFEPPP